MAPDPLFYQLLLVALVLICLLLHIGWPDPRRPAPQTTAKPDQPRCQRSKAPTPFAGYMHKPICEACEQALDTRPHAPGSPPPMIIFTRDAGAPSIPLGIFVPLPIARMTAGSGAAIAALTGISAVSRGVSSSVGRAKGISMQPIARSSVGLAQGQAQLQSHGCRMR